MIHRSRLLAVALTGTALLAACGGSDGDSGAATATIAAGAAAAGSQAGGPGGAGTMQHRLVRAADAPMVLSGTEGIALIDVRTPEEFAEGHLDGATLIDYNAPGFAEQVAELDRSVPYFVYCRSGNRSAGAVAVMAGLGFETVYELDGGILAWEAAGNAVVR